MTDDNAQRQRSEQLQMTRIVLRPTGNPLPLAFMSLAIATVGFSSLQLGVVGAEEETVAGSSRRFGVTGVAEITGSAGWETAAGALGVALAILALYAAFGFELEEADHPVQLPVLRRGAGTRPLHDNIEEQVEGISREAGVRQQL